VPSGAEVQNFQEDARLLFIIRILAGNFCKYDVNFSFLAESLTLETKNCILLSLSHFVTKEFPIRLIAARSSGISHLAFFLLILAFIGLLVFYLSMSPSDHSSLELKTLWFIDGVPLWVKQFALFSIIILGLSLIIQLVNKRSENGTLLVNEEQLEIYTKKKTIQLMYDDIKEVAFIANNLIGNEFKVFFKTKNNKILRLQLPHYLMANDLTNSLSFLAARNIKILSDSVDPYWPES